MRSIVLYYLAILLPLIAIAIIAQRNGFTAAEFSIVLLCYALIYHPIITGLRLIALKKISGSDFWKTFIPFWNLRYFGSLFLNK